MVEQEVFQGKLPEDFDKENICFGFVFKNRKTLKFFRPSFLCCDETGAKRSCGL